MGCQMVPNYAPYLNAPAEVCQCSVMIQGPEACPSEGLAFNRVSGYVDPKALAVIAAARAQGPEAMMAARVQAVEKIVHGPLPPLTDEEKMRVYAVGLFPAALVLGPKALAVGAVLSLAACTGTDESDPKVIGGYMDRNVSVDYGLDGDASLEIDAVRPIPVSEVVTDAKLHNLVLGIDDPGQDQCWNNNSSITSATLVLSAPENLTVESLLDEANSPISIGFRINENSSIPSELSPGSGISFSLNFAFSEEDMSAEKIASWNIVRTDADSSRTVGQLIVIKNIDCEADECGAATYRLFVSLEAHIDDDNVCFNQYRYPISPHSPANAGPDAGPDGGLDAGPDDASVSRD